MLENSLTSSGEIQSSPEDSPPQVEVEPQEVAAPPPLPIAVPVQVTTPQEVQVTSPPNVHESGGFEMQLGRVWLVRFGVVLLLTGLVLLGNFAYKNWIREMPNGVRLLGLFLCSGVLIEIGRRLAAKPSLGKFGEVVLAGGMAFFYYCTFAAYHVSRLKVIENAVVAGLLLLAAAGAIVAISWKRNARTTAVMGILLASYSTMLQPVGWLSCVSAVVLAAAGLALMLRPGWVGPGVSAMAGTYGAFLGWQLMGASGAGRGDLASLWFLPPVWVMLALPGMLDRFRETMGERARAWFTGVNNAAFFGLFSALWWQKHGRVDYWWVCGIFGLLLLVMGVIGRGKNQTAAGVNLFQGLALLTLAMVIRLEGFHLALGLSLESLLLAAAFVRFRGWSEVVFSCLAAMGASGCILAGRVPGNFFPQVPLWSAGLGALMVGLAAIALRLGSGRVNGTYFPQVVRIAAGVVYYLAVVVGIAGWAWWLPSPWPAPVMAALAAGLSIGMLYAARRVRMPEAGIGGLIFLAAAIWPGAQLDTWWPLLLSALASLAGAWVWHRWGRLDEDVSRRGMMPGLNGWAYAAATAAASGWAILCLPHGPQAELIGCGAVGLVLLAIAIFGKVDRLAPCSALVLLVAAVRLVLTGTAPVADPLWITGSALAMLALLLAGAGKLPGMISAGTGWILRSIAFIGACLFWDAFAPKFIGDGLAFMAIVLLAISIVRKVRALPEVWGFLGLAVFWLLSQSSEDWKLDPAAASWRGWVVVLALAALVVWTGYGHRGGSRRSNVVAGWGAVVMGSIWATQMLVWRHDWHLVSVLWTLLGFGLVSAGLALRMAVLRQSGFCLLSMAVIKIFVKDVWDFNAFTRVGAFIVLGIALILLGLFYNRFAPVLKRLLEEEKNVP